MGFTEYTFTCIRYLGHVILIISFENNDTIHKIEKSVESKIQITMLQLNDHTQIAIPRIYHVEQ